MGGLGHAVENTSPKKDTCKVSKRLAQIRNVHLQAAPGWAQAPFPDRLFLRWGRTNSLMFDVSREARFSQRQLHKLADF